MNEHSRAKLDDYYADAASWNRDRVQTMRSTMRLSWWIAGLATSIALLEGIALILLTPLKTVVPYTLMVDRTTGYVQALKPLEQAKIAPDAALTQSFIVQYVIAREGFDLATLNANYRKVSLLSADSARRSYLQTMQNSNLQSPLAVYPRATVIEVRVKSVSPMGTNAALVRFDTMRSDAGREPLLAGSWVALVRYRYSADPMMLEDRFVNPLGFQVIRYRKDPEALPAPVVGNAVTAVPAGNLPATVGTYYDDSVQPIAIQRAVPR